MSFKLPDFLELLPVQAKLNIIDDSVFDSVFYTSKQVSWHNFNSNWSFIALNLPIQEVQQNQKKRST